MAQFSHTLKQPLLTFNESHPNWCACGALALDMTPTYAAEKQKKSIHAEFPARIPARIEIKGVYCAWELWKVEKKESPLLSHLSWLAGRQTVAWTMRGSVQHLWPKKWHFEAHSHCVVSHNLLGLWITKWMTPTCIIKCFVSLYKEGCYTAWSIEWRSIL